MDILTSSRWLSDCAKQSVLMREWPITAIPNTIVTDVWRPVDKAVTWQLLQLPPDVPLLLFGAIGGTKDLRKGFPESVIAILHPEVIPS